MNVVVRADASNVIGSGHVMRCLALADEARTAGHEVVFVTRDAPGNLDGWISDRWGFEVRSLPSHSPYIEPGIGTVADQMVDAQETSAAIRGDAVDWLIVDHYSLDAAWEGQLASHAARLLVIDDLANRDHHCDVLVDQNLLPPGRYAGKVPETCDLLVGPRFALLRREFRHIAGARAIPASPERVLVTFGGGDATQQTRKTLEVLDAINLGNIIVDVIVGPSHPSAQAIREFAAERPMVHIHEKVSKMAALLTRADLAIGAGGVTALERLCAGLPSIVIATADNQAGAAEALAREGLVYYLGRAEDVRSEDLVNAVHALWNSHLRHAMARRGMAMVDGMGTRRVVRALQRHEEVRIREATEEDCEMTLAWRNHVDTRRYSFDAKELSFDEHFAWFHAILRAPRRYLLIGEVGGSPVGVVRYDIDDERKSAEVSIYLDPALRGQGHGLPLLEAANDWLRKREGTVQQILSRMRSDNVASDRVFGHAGYRPHHRMLVRNIRPPEQREIS